MAVGVEGARIAKSLSFKVEDKPVIIVVAVVRQPEGQLPALPPPLRRPPGRKGGKGAVQMEVRRVDEFQHIQGPVPHQGENAHP